MRKRDLDLIMILTTFEDITAEQKQDILNGLYTLEELNEYITYMISSTEPNKPDND